MPKSRIEQIQPVYELWEKMRTAPITGAGGPNGRSTSSSPCPVCGNSIDAYKVKELEEAFDAMIHPGFVGVTVLSVLEDASMLCLDNEEEREALTHLIVDALCGEDAPCP